MEELQGKIKSHEEKIEEAKAQIASEDENDTFGYMNIVELKREIWGYEESIKNLQDRINGTVKPGPTAEQIARADYVLSDDYDND